MTEFMGKLDLYIDHRIYEMLSSNATVEIPATTTYLLVACFDSKIDHMQKMLYQIICYTYPICAGDDGI